MIDIKYFYVKNYENQRIIPNHNHTIFEYVYYIEGEGKGIVEDTEYFFSPDTFIIIPPGLFHSEKHFGCSRVYIVGFEILNDDNLPELKISKSNSTIKKVFNKMEIEKFSRKKYSQNVIQGLFTQALFLSMREENAKENEKISDAINNAISYIDQYYNTDIDLDELAKSSGYCTDRFRNLFKIATGEAPKKYILKKRLNYAKVLILEGHNDMNEISNMLGFKHYTRFSLFFKEETGLSPKEYKDQYSKN